MSPVEYDRLYREEVLGRLDPQATIDTLQEMARPLIPVLLCFEVPNRSQWCHRAMVSAWLHETLGLHVPEAGFEDPAVVHHPFMPPELRLAA